MAFDGTDFVDTDYTSPKPTPPGGKAPTREELDAQLTGTQQQLTKLREAQEQLERARAAVEEMRRKRTEFSHGRTEMLQSLTRGIGILQQGEHEAQQTAAQMGKSLEGLREALTNVERLNEQAWSAENWEQELTRALTTIENARLEYGKARIAWPLLDGKGMPATPAAAAEPSLASLPLGRLCKMGLALTWPVMVVALLGFLLISFILWKR